MRLDRYICHATALSRSQAQRSIRGGAVSVDGLIERDPSRHLDAEAQVVLEGKLLSLAGPRYFMLNKPAGYVCATEDGAHPTVLDLLHEERAQGLHPVGRLDIDTTGLVLISDDGAWSHRVTSPRRECPKRYRVTLAEDISAETAQRFAEGIALKVTPQIVRPDEIARRLGPDAVHNGLLAEADPLDAPDLSELPAEGIVLVLDQITDPHNVGAILRSAAAFGVKALVTTARHSPEATGVLAKSASGALDYVPIVTVQNLARGLAALRERGFLLVGLDSEGDADLAATELTAPLALVLGAEGKGLRQLTRETCDRTARLDLPGAIKSLNVSNAAALALYVATTRLAK